ncbi:MAG TPA: CHAP domain-containing protein, partial [Chloroflexia bacterium]|nr:CHAP domain-containing protein [Chloroflexia bacterium]
GCVFTLALGAFGLSAQVSAGATPASNPYPYGTPTYWAWQNRTDLPANLGEPKDWDDNALTQGWPVTGYPRRGDVAVFEPGVQGTSPTGNVAVVEQVLENGAYIASQMDGAAQVTRQEYPVMKGIEFIHYKVDTRTTWGFAGGQAGWTALDLGQGNMGGPGWFYPVAGSDPRLISPDLDIPLESYNAVEVDMVIGAPVTDPTLQVYFSTAEQPGFTNANSVIIEGKADGQLARYQFSFANNPMWKGHLTRLRLDPAGPGTTGGVRVDRVRLVHAEPEVQAYTATSQPLTPASFRDRSKP